MSFLPDLTRRFFLKHFTLAAGSLALPGGLGAQGAAAAATDGGDGRADESAAAPPPPSADEPLPIIPYPVQAARTPGDFRLDRNTQIVVSAPELRSTAQWLQRALATPTGLDLRVTDRAASNAIAFRRIATPDAELGNEGYRLTVTAKGIEIEANGAAGAFFAAQTLLQLMPPTVESGKHVQGTWSVTGARVVDRPRFGWRGLMLDVARRYFDKAFVKDYIDQMAKYKMNVLHLHLTDNEGWRIEVKGLPRLTTVGAWHRVGAWNAEPFELAPHARVGGFYTQEDMREIIAYAAERHIMIMPEFDVPGHSYALTAAFPDLSCSGAPSDVVCPGNDRVYTVFEQIMAEMAPLFPSTYVHIGGDEVGKNQWRMCPKCQARMQTEKLKDLDELQSYFIRRVERIVSAQGKQLVGWDEILDGGLAPNSVVMTWRGNGREAAREAARQGHPVLMTPSTNCYLDYANGDLALEPRQNQILLLHTAYTFEPIPDGVDPKLVLGSQGNLWTGREDHPRHAQYMTWPRSMALAEVFWSARERRPWPDFVARVERHFPRLDARGVRYARSIYYPMADYRRIDGQRRIVLGTQIPGVELYYTFEGSSPDNGYPRYTEPLAIPQGATVLRVVAYRNGERVSDIMNQVLMDLQTRCDRLRGWRTAFELHDFWLPPPKA